MRYTNHIFVLGLAVTVAVFAQSELPEGPGQQQVQKICSGCHDLSIVTQTRVSKQKWGEIVDSMVSRGAEGSDDDLNLVVNYLAAHFGPEAATKINVNKATAADLAKALALTSDEATAIVDYRTKNGNFKDLDQLEGVPGVDRKKIEAKKDLIVF